MAAHLNIYLCVSLQSSERCDFVQSQNTLDKLIFFLFLLNYRGNTGKGVRGIVLLNVLGADLHQALFSNNFFPTEKLLMILDIVYHILSVKETHRVNVVRIYLKILRRQKMLNLVTLTVHKVPVLVHLLITEQHIVIIDIILIIMVLKHYNIILIKVHGVLNL